MHRISWLHKTVGGGGFDWASRIRCIIETPQSEETSLGVISSCRQVFEEEHGFGEAIIIVITRVHLSLFQQHHRRLQPVIALLCSTGTGYYSNVPRY